MQINILLFTYNYFDLNKIKCIVCFIKHFYRETNNNFSFSEVYYAGQISISINVLRLNYIIK